MNKPGRKLPTYLIGACWSLQVAALEVGITPRLDSVQVMHQGEPVTIIRNQDRQNQVKPYYSYTSRRCPPFCVQPAKAAPEVETIGELDVLAYLKRAAQGDESVLVVDTRLPKWPRRGMIPGAVNVPWTLLAPDADREELAQVLEQRFGARATPQGWDFSTAKTLALYCNGPWCSQSSHAVQYLLEHGYLPSKLKWYRGGMQSWENPGLTTVKAP
jgi:rhodanese-related sulfurtransferase